MSARRVSGVFSGIHEAVGQRTKIGRDLQNNIVVDDPLVSRFHAEMRARPDGRHELVDLGSRNGTFVNGRAVDRAILEELDLVSTGHHTFRLVGSGLAEYIDTGSITFQAAGGRACRTDVQLESVRSSVVDRPAREVDAFECSHGFRREHRPRVLRRT